MGWGLLWDGRKESGCNHVLHVCIYSLSTRIPKSKFLSPLRGFRAKLRHTEAAVQQYSAQLNMRKSENYGFASICSIPLAHAAARELKGQHPKGLTIKLAPNPKDIVSSQAALLADCYLITHSDLEKSWPVKANAKIQKNHRLHLVIYVLFSEFNPSVPDCVSRQPRCCEAPIVLIHKFSLNSDHIACSIRQYSILATMVNLLSYHIYSGVWCCTPRSCRSLQLFPSSADAVAIEIHGYQHLL